MPETIDRDRELQSLKPEDLLGKLDLSGPGLEAAKAAAEAGDRNGALAALLAYYREKYALPAQPEEGRARTFETADKITQHVLQWGPYEEADYGPEFDWEWDPRGDIEWVAAVYRFYWAGPLAQAYAATRDEKYARTFVELTTDWIGKHKLEDHKRNHPVYGWSGFVWLDIQTGIRATNICSTFRTMVHGEAFTPEFLELLLASLYDHQVKTKWIPMGRVHNKAVFEQRGFINIVNTFREFQECREWLALALERVTEVFLDQVTTDGVQREWSYGYHNGVLRDAVEIIERAESFGVQVSDAYRERVRLMHDYIFAVATPDLGAPMFGDGSRSLMETEDRSKWPLYNTLVEASELLGDPKYKARAELDRNALPNQKSYAFTEAGMYVLRNDWGPDQIHMGLHCSPVAISGHDQPDNGTFELYAYGRWLMPDTGFYTYGHDREGRAWHRQTRVHQTLTLDEKDSADDGRHLLWQSDDALDAVVVENGSYQNLTHRRSIWFVDHRFFVVLDEAMGTASGQLDLHFQFAPGDVVFDSGAKRAHTQFEDANVLVQTAASGPVSMVEEEGWFAWSYGHRTPRKALCYGYEGTAPAAFLTLIVPYRGTDIPTVSAALPEHMEVGCEAVTPQVKAFGQDWEVGRDLGAGKAWCNQV